MLKQLFYFINIMYINQKLFILLNNFLCTYSSYLLLQQHTVETKQELKYFLIKFNNYYFFIFSL